MHTLIHAGHTLIVNTECISPSSQLYQRFWLHEHKWPLKLSDSIIESLNTLSDKYEVETVKGEIDLTDCFLSDFKKPQHMHILDFLSHTKMERYPPAVVDTCINYLSSVARGKPEQYKIPRSTAIIVCGNL